MDFDLSGRSEAWLEKLQTFFDHEVLPRHRASLAHVAKGEAAPFMGDLQRKARAAGLWNLGLPELADDEPGTRLSNLEYAPLAEIMGRLFWAPEVFNCQAPDVPNMIALQNCATPEQKARWLQPLLEARTRSAFGMTEPDVASSDATNIATRMVRDGDDYVINGRKWWITGAMNPDAAVFIVMGKTDPTATRHRQQSQILVPRDSAGVSVTRGMEVFGYDDRHHGGHAEIEFRDVRVPADHLIGDEGDGFAIAQARLGPGRIHHCMRAIGVAELAFELTCQRASERVAFGRALAEQGVIRDWIAEARVRIEQLRLLVLKTAWLMDRVGNRGAHSEIQAIKIATPRTVEWVLDKAIQVHGAAGLSQDLPLAAAFASIRTLRFADGPDEVHKNALAKSEIGRQLAARQSQHTST
jgi:acyl-CoA dehydrogenase